MTPAGVTKDLVGASVGVVDPNALLILCDADAATLIDAGADGGVAAERGCEKRRRREKRKNERERCAYVVTLHVFPPPLLPVCMLPDLFSLSSPHHSSPPPGDAPFP